MMQGVRSIPAAIREILACPKCHGPLQDGVVSEKASQVRGEALVCTACGLAYPVEEGIPVLLIERATAHATAV